MRHYVKKHKHTIVIQFTDYSYTQQEQDALCQYFVCLVLLTELSLKIYTGGISFSLAQSGERQSAVRNK